MSMSIPCVYIPDTFSQTLLAICAICEGLFHVEWQGRGDTVEQRDVS